MKYYTVTQSDNTNVLTTYPVMFSNRNQAKLFVEELANKSLNYNIVTNTSNVDDNFTKQTSYTKFGSTNKLDSWNEESLDGYVLRKNGRGFILSSSPDDDMHETPYFYGNSFDGGWWRTDQQGWFFKNHSLDLLLERGAKFTDAESNSSDSDSVSSKPPNCTWEKYGRGWLLKPLKTHPNYEDNYLLDSTDGGWWNNTKKGWFFKQSGYNKYKLEY